ncbi:MAG: PHP domain-containing protein [Vicinamibacterales bacterium]
MIDLHLHTTASDGRCTATELVGRVAAAGVRVFAVTDHDTVAGHAEAARAAALHDLVFVPGIEVTAVWAGRDVHVLGYWVDGERPAFAAFLREQRTRRVARIEAIGAALGAAGAAIDLGPLLTRLADHPGTSVGRPDLARLLVAAGHAVSLQDAFDRYLAEGQPAYVARSGVSPEDAVALIHDAGGLASLAHPGVTRRDDRLEAWAAAGLDAIEAYHSDHSEADTAFYLERARALDLLVTGGSDFHGDEPVSHRARRRDVGGVTLPADAWQALVTRHAAAPRRAS